MKSKRKNCVVCGKGFLCPANQPVLFDKKKCAIRYYGKDWKSGLYVRPVKTGMTMEEKMEWIKSL